MGTRKKDQSNGNTYKGPILWEHVIYTCSHRIGHLYMFSLDWSFLRVPIGLVLFTCSHRIASL